MIKFKEKYVGIIFLVFIINVLSQTKETQFERFTENDGLSSSLAVRTIMQDSYGYLWIGTEQGLNKYDGYNFQNFYHTESDSLSLSSDFIRALCQDDDSVIWIGTRNGLNELDLSQNSKNNKVGFRHYFHDSLNEYSLSSGDIRSIYQDHLGSIWIGTANGLNKLNKKDIGNRSSVKFIRYFNHQNDTNTISNNLINSIVEDKNGNLWVGTLGGGLNKINLKTKMYTHFFNKNNSSFTKYIVTLFIDHKGLLWIGTYGGGLIKFNTVNYHYKVYKKTPKTNSLSNDHVFAIQEDKSGFLWIGTYGEGINKFDPNKEEFTFFKTIPIEGKSLSNRLIYSLFIDKANNLWAGSGNGLNKLDLKPRKFVHFRNELSNKNSIQDNYVNVIFKDHAGNTWIGTEQGLDRIDRVTKEYSHYKFDHNISTRNSLNVNNVFEDKENNLWIGTFGGGLYKFDENKHTFTQFKHESGNPGSLIDNRVNAIYQDGESSLLIGTQVGACKMNTKTNSFTNPFIGFKGSESLSDKKIYVFLKDSKNVLWVGTTSGLYSINYNIRKCEHYVHNPKDKNSITLGDVNEIFEDKNDVLWFGTNYGLNKYERDKNKFIHFTTENGLPNNYITNILEDDEGNLWISAGRFISKFDGKHFRNYDSYDGVKALKFNGNSAFKSQNGVMYFGGLSGIIKFSPGRIKNNPHKPKVVITSFKKYEKIIRSSLQLLDIKKLNLSYKDNFFSFEFAALDFTTPDKNQYAYRLEGFDKDWNYIGNRRYASYTNLDPGKYIFHVKASNNDGIWNEDGRSLTIIISPPFWQTWWFRILVGLAIIGTVLLLFKTRISKLEKEKTAHEEFSRRLIQSQENERKRIASELHDSLGQNLLIIKNRAVLGMRNKKDNVQEEQLKEISIAATSAIDEVRRTSYNLHPYQLDRLGLTKTLKSILNNIDNSSDINFSESIERIDGLFTKENEINIYRIVQECINNIVKHSGADNASINIKKNQKDIKINVNDDGKGFDAVHIYADRDPAKGFGIKNISRRVNIIGGSFNLNSSPGKGTRININIPFEI